MRAVHGPLLAGVDEVGRGPLAGPVVACAVIMPPDKRAIAGVDDSKRVVESERVRLAKKIRDTALAIGVGAASVREIDTYNIYHASTRAIRRALNRLPQRPSHVVIDGKAIRTLGIEHTAVVHGDARCYGIACASIVARRDRRSTNSGTASALIGCRLGLPPSSVVPRRKAFITPGAPTLSPAPTLKNWQRLSPTYMRPGPSPRRSIHIVRVLNGASMCRVKQSSGS